MLAGTPSPIAGTQYAWLTKDEFAARFAEDKHPHAQAYWAQIEPLLDE